MTDEITLSSSTDGVKVTFRGETKPFASLQDAFIFINECELERIKENG